MARDTQRNDRDILEAALSGYQSELSRVTEAMSAVRSRLGIRGPRRWVGTAVSPRIAIKDRSQLSAWRIFAVFDQNRPATEAGTLL
jgi:hypothetical protein